MTPGCDVDDHLDSSRTGPTGGDLDVLRLHTKMLEQHIASLRDALAEEYAERARLAYRVQLLEDGFASSCRMQRRLETTVVLLRRDLDKHGARGNDRHRATDSGDTGGSAPHLGGVQTFDDDTRTCRHRPTGD